MSAGRFDNVLPYSEAAYHCGDCAAGKSHQPATAYERAQTDRDDNYKRQWRFVMEHDTAIKSLTLRLTAALQRIEQLEVAMARQQAWSRPPAEMCLKCGTAFATPGHATTHSCGNRGNMIPLILICIAVLLLSLPVWPFSEKTVAFILALGALVTACLRWHA